MMRDCLLCGLDRLVRKFLVLEHCSYVSKAAHKRVILTGDQDDLLKASSSRVRPNVSGNMK